jgi:hypothetical protein
MSKKQKKILKKSKILAKTVYCCPFQTPINIKIISNKCDKLFNDLVKSLYDKWDSYESNAVSVYSGGILYIIFNGFPCLTTIAHECYHIMIMVLEHVGVKTRDEEFMAYMFGGMVDDMVTVIKKLKKEKL